MNRVSPVGQRRGYDPDEVLRPEVIRGRDVLYGEEAQAKPKQGDHEFSSAALIHVRPDEIRGKDTIEQWIFLTLCHKKKIQIRSVLPLI